VVVHDEKYKGARQPPHDRGSVPGLHLLPAARNSERGVLALPGHGERTTVTMGAVTVEEPGLPVLQPSE
jgi:hypothetical protein